MLLFRPVLFGSVGLGWLYVGIMAAAFLYLAAYIFLFGIRRGGSPRAQAEPAMPEHTVTMEIELADEAPQVGASCIMGTRAYQQDRVGHCEVQGEGFTGIFAAVCDGMGGMDNGDRASDLCMKSLLKSVAHTTAAWRDIPMFLHSAAVALDAEVAELTDEAGRRIRSGTTLVAACLNGNELHWVSAGDSRMYLLTADGLRRITRDHNYALKLDMMAKSGRITSQQAADDNKREALISYIGMGNIELVDGNKDAMILQNGDIVLICSDGVTKLLTDLDLEYVLREHRAETAEEIAQAVTTAATAHRRRSQDNTSAVILKVR